MPGAASETALSSNMSKMANFYSEQVNSFDGRRSSTDKKDIVEAAADFIDTDPKKISWSRGLIADLARGTSRPLKREAIRESAEEPLRNRGSTSTVPTTTWSISRTCCFRTPNHPNTAIAQRPPGIAVEFSTLIATSLPDLNVWARQCCRCFPLYLYEKAEDCGGLQLDKLEIIDGYRRRDAITDGI